ncbi:MAG: DEAD/DEAH box helicase, partial [Myxococcota bacterium]
MIAWILKLILGTKNAREMKRLGPVAARVNALEAEVKKLSDDALRGKTGEFRRRLDAGQALDELLPEAFAVVREAAQRTIGQRHYDVQLIGGMILHQGKISEMKTGEGKTLVSTLPCYLNALEGRGVHVVTVNDYLAKRDAEWMGKIHKFLGMTVGCVVHGLTDRERQKAYRSDITYGMNSEFGFDYLRDNMKQSVDRMVQRDLHYAVVDEVDSILIDEARTPLIISGPAEYMPDKYKAADMVARKLVRDEHFEVKEKERAVHLLEAGIVAAEKLLNIESFYLPGQTDWPH